MPASVRPPASASPASNHRRRTLSPGLLLATVIAATPALAAAEPASAALPATTAVSDRVPVADRAALFTTDIDRLVASQSAAAAKPTTAADTDTAHKPGPIQSVLRGALALLGTPYRWGGSSTNGFDCSGLVGYVFKNTLGIELPRISREMATSGQRIERSALSAGDLVFFSRRRGGRIDHVGIYVGNGQFVHAPRSGRDVTVSSLDSGYWAGKFSQARRIVDIGR